MGVTKITRTMKTKKMNPLALFILTLIFGATACFAQSGSWTKKEKAIKGTWSIVEKDGKKVISLKGFSTKKAPDLKIFLSPQTVGGVTAKNAVKGSVLVSKLKSHKGDQSYVLPAGVDLSKYKSVIIHCEKYTKLWGAAAL